MVRITINPANENEVYASSFFSGLLKIVDDVPTLLYNQNNSGLETILLGPVILMFELMAAFDKAEIYGYQQSC
jgi:hypothetical protein